MRLFTWEWSWQSKPLRQPWHSILLAASSAILFSASAYSYLSTKRFIAESSRASGAVVRILEGDRGYYPQVRFVDKAGTQHTFDSKLQSIPPRYSVGETVSVVYSQTHPDKAAIGNFGELWFVSTITGLLAVALGTAAVLIWVFRYRLFEQYKTSPNKLPKNRPRVKRAAF